MTPRTWRALVVDDNAINLEVAVGLLQQMGLQTDSASGGEQAVAQALAVAYDLIVMDVQMPGVDGIEATRRIRRSAGPTGGQVGWRQPPIIALTANAEANDRSACLDAGMNDYLTKPVVPQVLQLALQRWMPGWAAAAPGAGSTGLLHSGLATIEGFDLAGSLQNLGGQMPRLERVLRRFATTYRAGEPALMQAARQGDRAALWQACHALRGACAVLCATALVQHIEALEAALQTQREPAPDGTLLLDKVRPLQAALVSLARQLEAALGRS
jgi:CheY-like chemotaxis protein/HPt (histidine-containing phosphotransfer) domain-containing protein